MIFLHGDAGDVVLLDVALGESLHPAVHALPRLLWLPFEVHRLDLKRNAKSGFLIEIATSNRFWGVERKTNHAVTWSARTSRRHSFSFNSLSK